MTIYDCRASTLNFIRRALPARTPVDPRVALFGDHADHWFNSNEAGTPGASSGRRDGTSRTGATGSGTLAFLD
jgi:hypothetical protein